MAGSSALLIANAHDVFMKQATCCKSPRAMPARRPVPATIGAAPAWTESRFTRLPQYVAANRFW
jgi:hypothetical protein